MLTRHQKAVAARKAIIREAREQILKHYPSGCSIPKQWEKYRFNLFNHVDYLPTETIIKRIEEIETLKNQK